MLVYLSQVGTPIHFISSVTGLTSISNHENASAIFWCWVFASLFVASLIFRLPTCELTHSIDLRNWYISGTGVMRPNQTASRGFRVLGHFCNASVHSLIALSRSSSGVTGAGFTVGSAVGTWKLRSLILFWRSSTFHNGFSGCHWNQPGSGWLYLSGAVICVHHPAGSLVSACGPAGLGCSHSTFLAWSMMSSNRPMYVG